jgi:2-iminobutanoate/2-iminopropanoate deaminase
LPWGKDPSAKVPTQTGAAFPIYERRSFLHCPRKPEINIMATKTIIKPAKSPTAVGPYNHAVRIGDLLFCAGQIPIDPKDGNLITGDIKAQTERVLENVKAILEDQKLTFANVVKSTVFLTNLGDFAGMNEIYAKYFTNDFPARSTIQVAALPKAANVEIEVIAHF